jgi:hypothetical protein
MELWQWEWFMEGLLGVPEVDGRAGPCSMAGFFIRGVISSSSAITLCVFSAAIKTANFFRIV